MCIYIHFLKVSVSGIPPRFFWDPLCRAVPKGSDRAHRVEAAE